MRISDYLTVNRIFVDIEPITKNDIINFLVEKCNETYDCIRDKEKLKEEILEREKSMTTGIGLGLAIPHSHSKYIDDIAIILATKKSGVDYQALDGEPVYIFCMILGPEAMRKEHMQILAQVAKLFQPEQVREFIKNADSPSEIKDYIELLEF